MSHIRSKARAEKHRQRGKVMRYVIISLVFILVGSFLWYTESSKFDLVVGHVDGAGLVPEESMRRVIAEESEKSLWKILSRNNFVLYPKSAIESRLRYEYPAINDVDVVVGLRDVDVYIVEREARYLWCGDSMYDIPQEGSPQCFFVDTEGVIFGKAANFNGSTYVRFYREMKSESGRGVLGLELAPRETMGRIEDFIEKFRGIGFKSEKVEWKNDREIVFRTDRGIDIIVQIQSEAQRVAHNIKLVYEEKAISATSTLPVIDARIENKIYLQYR